MNIIPYVTAVQNKNKHVPQQETGIHLVPWSLPTIPVIPHWHDELELCCCLSGEGVFYVQEREYEIRAGDLIVINHVERHTAKSHRGSVCTNLHLFFHASTLEQIDAHLLLPFVYDRARFRHHIPAESAAARQIRELLHQMQEEWGERRPARGPLLKSLLIQICALLVRHYQSDDTPMWQSFYAKYTTLRAGLTYMKTHFREDMHLEDVARAMALSASRARHLFTEVMGTGFKTHLIHLRLQEAQRLLVQTDLPVEAIVEQSGFQSTSSFYREFRKFVRETPQAYKQRMHGTDQTALLEPER